MRGCIFISKSAFQKIALVLALVAFCAPLSALAQQVRGGALNDEPVTDEILSGPFSEYGEFDSSEDEQSDEKFFQFGRFFGIGLGAGFTTATGNAGKLYQGGFPTVDFRLNYWFDFDVALQVDFQNSKHNFNINKEPTDVNLFRMLFQVKYYFDTRDLSAPITFVGPHLIAGGGFYQRTDNVASGSGSAAVQNAIDSQNTFGFNVGAGFELTLKPKKTYLQLEALLHFITFGDDNTPKFADAGIPNKAGNWITTGIAIVWTW